MTHDVSIRRLYAGFGVLALYVLFILLPSPEGLTPAGKKSIALMLCAVLVWVFDVLPLAVSSILFTLLTVVAGVVPLPKAMANFATPTMFFVFAMFCISIAFQKSGLSRRIMLWTSLRSRGNPSRLLFFLMMVSAALSSFLADIPVCAMMFPWRCCFLKRTIARPAGVPSARPSCSGSPLPV